MSIFKRVLLAFSFALSLLLVSGCHHEKDNDKKADEAVETVKDNGDAKQDGEAQKKDTETEGPAEEAGKKVDEAMQDVKKKLHDATEDE